MAINLNREEGIFRNELIFTSDAKVINIDSTLVNLFMLLKHNGVRPKQRTRRGENVFIELSKLKSIFQKIEEEGNLSGFNENPEAVELWLRTNLTNLVNRGNSEKEKVSSLRPIHLESYRVRNAPNTRDYFSADQVYLMLSQKPSVKNELKNFLMEGWDSTTNQLLNGNHLDVDSLGILHLIKNVNPGFLESNSDLNRIKPLLEKQAELFCDDVHKLLVYKNEIPRNVLIDYLKTITSFHLSLYIHKAVYLLPKMIDESKIEVTDDWNIVVDVTDNFESKISNLAINDAEKNFNSLYNYIKSTFQINAVIARYKLDKADSDTLIEVLRILNDRNESFDLKFETHWDYIYGNFDKEDKDLINEMVKYETTYFDRYVELLMKIKGPYQLKYYPQFMDSISQKNNDRGFLAQGRSKKHPRRYVLGTRLLETLVQIQVLHLDNEKFITKSLSIEDLMKNLKERYGLIINGLNEERFENADVNTILAFKENVEAFKLKLRQIGFYNDLSDAYILQKVRPRYELL
ncbi:hypothetical protein G6N05_14140 [Flavobacterium sp. F372]|uniref:Uncharacterized protein n=1 Tax=Flavobacterium bernardetii TaxID=2813823 RepID=A0ABR7J1R8_9FLAO|nr:hypothetical protein [Flavobacterium bernardetii]MBC5836009.1 hypothetical protein [Flavobacterium bernardetii]NHF71251.1 hypothetical protein [Flavobacterium bernardetii]